MLFGVAGLAAGGLFLVLDAIGEGRFYGAPEFLLFLGRLGWTLILSSALWETIAATKFLLHIADTSSGSERP